MSKNNGKNANKSKDRKKLAIVAIAAITLVAVVFSLKKPGDSATPGNKSGDIPVAKNTDIIIQTQDITKVPSFYPAEVDGVNLEVIAVKATDGTIRTAFNTCQVCYSSGRGYYKAEGDELVCQNCTNRFSVDDIEVTRGGCNPVPITKEYKTVSDDSITISKDFLTEATVIFSNWK